MLTLQIAQEFTKVFTMNVKPKPTKHLWFTVFAAYVSLTAYVHAQVIPLDSPTSVTHGGSKVAHEDAQDKPNGRFGLNSTYNVDNRNEERAPNTGVSSQAINNAVETILQNVGRLKELSNAQKTTFQLNGPNVVSASSPKMSIKHPHGKIVDPPRHSALEGKIKARQTSNLKFELRGRLKREDKSLDEAFIALKFKNNDMELFENPLLDVLVYYAKVRSEKNYHLLLIETLRKHYEDEVLARVLVTAKKTYPIAEDLEKMLLQSWRVAGKDIHAIFSLLNLDKHRNIIELLNDPMLSTWFAYVELWNDNPYSLMSLALLKKADFNSLNNILVAAKERVGNADFLETLQYELWKQSGEDIFMYLKLDEEGEKVLESPAWSTWVFYLKHRGGEHDELMLSKFKKFSDDELMRIIARGKKSETTRSFAEKLEEYLWMKNKKTSDEVVKLLKLKKMGAKMFSSREFRRWDVYLHKVAKNPDRFLLISELKKHFSSRSLQRMMKDAEKAANKNEDALTLKIVTTLRKQLEEKKAEKRSK